MTGIGLGCTEPYRDICLPVLNNSALLSRPLWYPLLYKHSGCLLSCQEELRTFFSVLIECSDTFICWDPVMWKRAEWMKWNELWSHLFRSTFLCRPFLFPSSLLSPFCPSFSMIFKFTLQIDNAQPFFFVCEVYYTVQWQDKAMINGERDSVDSWRNASISVDWWETNNNIWRIVRP